MAYETGGASGVNDLLDKLRVFAISQGWAVDFFGARGAGNVGSQALLLNKGGLFFGFFTDTGTGTSTDPGNFFACFQYPGPYVNTTDKVNQANRGEITWSNNMTGPFQAYHFFSGNNDAGQSYIHTVVEAQPGSFRHNGIGVINKIGAITTGAYNHGLFWNYNVSPYNYIQGINDEGAIPWSSWKERANGGGVSNTPTVVRADVDGVSPRYFNFQKNTNNIGTAGRMAGGPFGNSGVNVTTAGLTASPSGLTGRSCLVPIIGFASRPSGFFSPVGGPPDMRFVVMTNLLPGELISLGPDSWRVFPIIRKNGAAGQENSGVWGFAYRVVP